MKRKLFSILTALALCLTLLPGTAWAAEKPEDKSGGWVYPYVTLVPKETTTYSAKGGTITWEPVLDGDTVVSGTLTLTNVTIEAEETGIQIPVPAVIVLEGTNSITVTKGEDDSVDHAGIVVDRYDYSGEPPREDLTIRGSGSLTINSNQFGIIADGNLTIDETTVSVTTQADKNCIIARNGDLTVRGSTVTAKDSGGVTTRSGGLCSDNGNISVIDSTVTAISKNGHAINAHTGDVRFTNSDVVAIGNVESDKGIAPIIFDVASEGIHFQISGGTLFAQNNGSGRDIVYYPDRVTATDSAAIYYHDNYYLIATGDNIQYTKCSYNEITGEITVGNGFIVGNVEWSDNVLFGPTTSINGYSQINGEYVAGKITIPDGVVATIPSGSGLYNYGTLTNNGTLIIEGAFQSAYQPVISGSTGSLINNGTINITVSGTAMSNVTVTNNGTLNIDGLYSNFPTGSISGGVINGLVREYNTSVSPKQFFYVAHGDAKLLKSLPLAILSSQKQTMTVPSGSTLTIPEGIILDSSQSSYGITNENLSECLSVDGDLVVNGTLRLPANTTKEQIEELHLSGVGQIEVAGGSTYYPINVTGGAADKTTATAGESITLTSTPIAGKTFYGWTSSDVTITDNGDGAYTFTMPGKAVTITAQYLYTVTFNSRGGSDVASQSIPGGNTAAKPSDPTRDKCTFIGWYADSAGTTAYDFTTPITDDLTLYAKWNVPVESISLNQSTLSLTTGGTAALTVTFSPNDASNKSVTYTSSDTAVATVDASGKVTAVSAGTATITATAADGGLTADCTVTVTVPSPSTSGGSGASNLPVSTTGQNNSAVTTTTTAAPAADSRGGTASSAVSSAMGSEIVRQAVENNSESVVIAPEITGGVTGTEVSIPASTVGEIGSKTGAGLTVSTPVADVTIPNGALGSLSAAGGAVTVAAAQKDGGVELTVTAGGRTVESIPGGVKLAVPVSDAAPGTVAVLVHGDGTRQVVRKSVAEGGSITVPLDGSAKLEIVDNSKQYSDVSAGSWAADAVAFASAHELFNGTGEGQFSPDLPMSRGMLAVVLYNLESNPGQALTGVFTDVSNGAWYAGGVAWAAENGIVNGYGGGLFGPNDSITREQLAVMLWRYAGSPAAANKELNFKDADSVSGYALEAMRWAVENGILNGYGNGLLGPQGLATRAQAAQMLKNYMSKQF